MEELENLEPDIGVAGSTRINGLTCTSVYVEENNMTWPLLTDAIREIKIKYVNEYPKYKRFITANSGEIYDVFEDISGKLLIQHYPENGYMGEHTDHSSQRNYNSGQDGYNSHCHSNSSSHHSYKSRRHSNIRSSHNYN